MGIRYNKKYVPKDRQVATRGPRDMQLKQPSMAVSEAPNEIINNLKEHIEFLQTELSSRPAPGAGMYTPEQVDEEIVKALTAETSKLKLDYETRIKELELESIRLNNTVRALTEERDALVRDRKSMEVTVEERVKVLANEVKAEYDLLLEERDNKLDNLTSVSEMTISALKDKVLTLTDTIDTLKNAQSSGGMDLNAVQDILQSATARMEELALKAGTPVEEIDPDRPQMEDVFVDPLEANAKDLEHKIKIEDVSPKKKEDMASKARKLKGLMGKLPEKRPI